MPLCVCCIVLLMGCRNAATTAPQPQVAGAVCVLHTDGAALRDVRNNPILLRGSNMIALADMEKGGTNWQAKLGDLARAGARVVRLPVREREMSQTFTALKLLPFVRAANAQGIYVIIAFDFAMDTYDNDRFDFVEDWLREQITYFNGNPNRVCF